MIVKLDIPCVRRPRLRQGPISDTPRELLEPSSPYINYFKVFRSLWLFIEMIFLDGRYAVISNICGYFFFLSSGFMFFSLLLVQRNLWFYLTWLHSQLILIRIWNKPYFYISEMNDDQLPTQALLYCISSRKYLLVKCSSIFLSIWINTSEEETYSLMESWILALTSCDE